MTNEYESMWQKKRLKTDKAILKSYGKFIK